MNEIWLLASFFFLFSFYYILKNRFAFFFPSSKEMIDVILDFADIKKDDVLYDLGSGDGRILIEAAKKNIPVVGIEHKEDIFDQNLSKATIIIAYLSRKVTLKLQNKIKEESKSGTKIILVDHPFQDWKPEKTVKVGFIPIRLYVK